LPVASERSSGRRGYNRHVSPFSSRDNRSPWRCHPVPSSDSCSDLMEALAGENLFLRKQLALYIE